MHKISNTFKWGGVMGVIAILGVVVGVPKAAADEPSTTKTSNASITVSASCSMTANINTAHTATLPNGVWSGGDDYYPSGIGKTTIATFCNDASGYSIYAVGYTGDTISGGSNNKLHSSTLGSSYDIVTGTATSGDVSNWSMKVTNATSDSHMSIQDNYNSYHSVPASYDEVVKYNTTTDATLGSTIETTYGAYIAASQAASTYAGKVKYVLVHPNTMVAGTYTIAYNANGGSGTMTSDTNLNNYEPQTIKTNSFTAPSGYAFAGWCTTQDQTQNPQTTCSGTTYTNQGTILPSTVTDGGTLALYAMWSQLPTMQAFAAGTLSTTCATMNQNDTINLIDSRDGESYKVAKLADNKCWMVENLNLAGGTALDAEKTDVTSEYITNYSAGDSRLAKTDGKLVLPASDTAGFNTNNYSYVYNSGNKTNCGASGQNTPCYSYYSWDAATLGSGRSISTDNTDAPYSICPKGWKLPSTYNGSGTAAEATDFRALMIGYGGSNSVQTYNSSSTPTGATMYGNIGPGTTPNFLLAGYYGYGSFGTGGSAGYYWSSTSYSYAGSARYLYFFSSSVNLASPNDRYGGFSVRCLLAG